MKILLIIPHYGVGMTYQYPHGILFISSYLKHKGYDVMCLNLNHYNSSKLSEVLKEQSFDIIATGGMFHFIMKYKNIFETARQYNSNAKIILGGGISSGDPEFVLNELKPDYLVLGEGEETTDRLLQAIKNGTDPKKVTGIAFMEGDSFIKTSPTPLIEDLDQIPYPDYEGFEYGYYMDNNKLKNQYLQNLVDPEKRRVGFLISSRDCVAKCTFCFRIMGGNYRLRSLENLFGEINSLIEKFNINELVLLDDMFAASKERVYEFCDKIEPMGLKWTCMSRVNMVNEELLKRMKEVGCYWISYGFESGSRKVLKSMKKGISPDQMERAIEATKKSKMAFYGMFIFGDPAETLETMYETINFSRKFIGSHMGFRLISPYPGTPLYINLKEKGVLKNLAGFHENPYVSINMTSLSTTDFLFMEKKIELENYYRKRFSFAKILKLKKISQQIFELIISCPHCKEKNNNCLIDFNKGSMIICKYCYQMIFIKLADFRFGNLSQIYQHFFFYIKRVVYYNVATHRLLFYVPKIIESMAAKLRHVLNQFRKALQALQNLNPAYKN